jgi:isopentenyldiphosphate isomerase
MFESDNKEDLDVVNEKDEVIGQINRGDMMSLRDTSEQYIRAIDVFIQRSNGDIFLPRRSKEKKIAPGGYDFSAAGHLPRGESYTQACIREINEETGIIVDPQDLALITKFKPTPHLFYFRELYLLRTDQEPKLSAEHTEATWVKPENLEDTVRNDIPTKETLIESIPVLVDYLNHNKTV